MTKRFYILESATEIKIGDYKGFDITLSEVDKKGAKIIVPDQIKEKIGEKFCLEKTHAEREGFTRHYFNKTDFPKIIELLKILGVNVIKDNKKLDAYLI